PPSTYTPSLHDALPISPNRYKKVSDLKKMPQRRDRRCSCTPASTAFSSNFQLLPSAFSSGAFHSSAIHTHLSQRRANRQQPVKQLGKTHDCPSRLKRLQALQRLSTIAHRNRIHAGVPSHLQIKGRISDHQGTLR